MSTNQSFRKQAVASRAGSKFGGSARTGASKGHRIRGIKLDDPRIESSKLVLGALEATIRSRLDTASAGDEIPSPLYLAAILSAFKASEVTHVDELLYLLTTVLPHINPGTLYHHYDEVARILMTAMKQEGAQDNTFRVLAVLKCFGHLLVTIPPLPEAWLPPKIQAVVSILSLTVDVRQEVRAAASSSIQSILSLHHDKGVNVLGQHISEFCHSLLKACTEKESVQAGLLVDFLKAALPLLPAPIIASICEVVLRLFTLAVPKLVATSMSIMTNLLKSPVAVLKPGMLRRLVPALIERKPSVDDTLCSVEFLQLLSAAMVRLHTTESGRKVTGSGDGSDGSVMDTAALLLPSVITAIMPYLESDAKSVQVGACAAIGSVLLNCVTKQVVAASLTAVVNTATADDDDGAPSILHSVIGTLGSFVQFRYKKAWPVCLPALGMLFRVVGEASYPLLIPLLSSLVELYNMHAEQEDTTVRLEDIDEKASSKISRNQVIRRDIRGLVGVALRYMGLERFLAVVPLKTPESSSELVSTLSATVRLSPGVSDDKLWVLKVIRQNLRYTRCSFHLFMSMILPAASECEAAARAAESAGLLKAAKLCKARSMMLWSLFPSVCVAPTDVPTGFNPQLGQLLTRAMSDANSPQLAEVVCAGLKVLIHRNRLAAGHDSDDIAYDLGLDGESVTTRKTRHGGAGGAGGSVADKDMQSREGSESGGKGRKQRKSPGSKAGTEFGSIFAESFGVGGSLFGESMDAGMLGDEEEGKAVIEGISAVSSLPHIPEEEAVANLAAIARFCKNFLPVLFNLFESISGTGSTPSPVSGSPNRKRRVLEAVSMYACISSPELLNSFYSRLMQMLNEGIQGLAAAPSDAGAHRVSTLLCLAQAMIPALSPEQALSLFHTSSSYITTRANGTLQKRTYKVLLTLLKSHSAMVHNPAFVDDLMRLLVSSVASCTPSAKRARLIALQQLVRCLNIENSVHLQVLVNLLGDVLLCVKDASKRTRDSALDLLIAMSDKMLEGGEGVIGTVVGNSGDLASFIRMLLAAMTTETPHVRAAAVICAARVIYQYSHLGSVAAMTTQVMPAVLALFADETREVVKSAVMFLRVAIACLDADVLKAQLSAIVPALFVSEDCRIKLRSRVRIVLERLVQKFGVDDVVAYVPSEDAPLIRHIRKQKQRMEKRKRSSNTKRTHEGFDILFGSDDRTEAEGLRDDEEDDVDAGFTDPARFRRSEGQLKRGRGEALFGLDGKEISDDQIFVNLEELEAKRGSAGKAGAGDDGDVDVDREKEVYGAGVTFGRGGGSSGGSVRSGGAGKKQRFGQKDDTMFTGARFKSSKAGGDVRRKGDKFEPFAYLPLDPRALSSKGGKKSVARFKDVVKAKRNFGGLKK